MYLTNYKSCITLVALAMMVLEVYFMDSILSIHLYDQFGIGAGEVGFIYAIPAVFYTIGCILLS